MSRNDDDPRERINFELTGELARWLEEMKNRGYFISNPEAARLAFVLLRYFFNRIELKNLEKNV